MEKLVRKCALYKVCILIEFIYLCTVIQNDTGLTAGFNLTFPDGSTNQTCLKFISIPITYDTVLEGDHDFTVAIIDAGSSPHAEVAEPSSTAVTIEDDESE